MSTIIRLPQMMRDAEIRAGSFDEATATVEVIWTTGAIGRRVTWQDGEFDEELVVDTRSVRLDRLNAGAPLLDTHSKLSLADVLGSVVPGTARLEGGKGLARVQLSNSPDAVDRNTKIKEGVVRNISVGYRIHAVEKKERAGQVALHRVIDWEPWELSAVPVPFDAGAQFRNGENASNLFVCRVYADPEMIIANQRLRREMRLRSYGMGCR